MTHYADPSADIELLVATLPADLQAALRGMRMDQLVEVVMDLGRSAEARFFETAAGTKAARLSERPVGLADIEHVTSRVGQFSDDNRAGIERTLHRISAIRNRRGAVIGLTLRVGRTVFGTIDLVRDLIESGKNLLVLGRPGIGKTTKLREIARVLADDAHRRVIVVDTSNEIGGDGDLAHPAIGSSRRMQVPRPDRQHAVMIEAVENHMPEVIVVDEIGTEAEAAAARTIAERGVQLVATAHGTTLDNLVMNPTLSDLVGGVATVTLGDLEARRRHTTKTVSERKAPPTFDIVIEMVDREELIVHADTAHAVDELLAGRPPQGERRTRGSGGEMITTAPEPEEVPAPVPKVHGHFAGGRTLRIFPYAIGRSLLQRVIRNLGVDARIVDDPEYADAILSLRSRGDDPRLERLDLPIHFVKKNNATHMRKVLQDLFLIQHGLDHEEVHDAVDEAEHAIDRALSERMEISLAPRSAGLRRMQHRIISRYHLDSQSMGSEPQRHLVIHPRRGKPG